MCGHRMEISFAPWLAQCKDEKTSNAKTVPKRMDRSRWRIRGVDWMHGTVYLFGVRVLPREGALLWGIWHMDTITRACGADSFAPCPYAVRRDGLVAAGVRSIRLDRPTSKMHRAPATRRTRASSQVWPD